MPPTGAGEYRVPSGSAPDCVFGASYFVLGSTRRKSREPPSFVCQPATVNSGYKIVLLMYIIEVIDLARFV